MNTAPYAVGRPGAPRYHRTPDAPVVLFRPHNKSGVDFLVSAFAEVCRLGGAVLVIAGPDGLPLGGEDQLPAGD